MAMKPVFSTVKHLQPVRDQKNITDCTPLAVCCFKEYREKIEGGLDGYLSPLFIYSLRPNKTNGMFPKDALEIMKTLGTCPDAVFPYEYGERKITDQEKKTARHFLIKDYKQIHTVDEIKQAIYDQGPVVCWTRFFDLNKSKEFWIQDNPAQSKVEHTACLVGWNDAKGFLLRNSLGEKWGDKGYTWVPYGAAMNAEYFHEFWMLIDDPITHKMSSFESLFWNLCRVWPFNNLVGLM